MQAQTPPQNAAATSPTATFTPEVLNRLSKLARIAIPESELATLGREMSAIGDLISALQAVNTEGVEPLSHPLAVMGEIALALRADVASAEIDRAANMANAPETENGLFLVPKVIE
jgi:aspartyl-tRNA(Asn)/glutamyl-tRNA(Gln) amidotransferase subunit C